MKNALLCIALMSIGHLHVSAHQNSVLQIKVYNDSTLNRSQTIHEMLMDIMNVTGLRANFELKKAKVKNIQASISHKKRYILYNPEFIDWVNRTTPDNWGTVALLAHEVGHHLNGHTIKRNGSNPQIELEADEFAGFVLFKLGATLQQAQEVMNHIANTHASPTHPGRSSRMQAIERGWTKAGDEIQGKKS